MMHGHRLTRLSRWAAVAIVCFGGALAAVWAAPRVSQAVAVWLHAPAVSATTVALGRLSLEPVDGGAAESGRAAGAARGTAGADGGAGSDATAAEGGSALGGPPGPGADPALGASVTVDTGSSFTLLGLTCRPPAAGTDATVWLRTSLDGVSWGPWMSAALETGADGDRGPARAFIEPVWSGEGRFVQTTAVASGGAAVTALDQVRLVAMDTDGDDSLADAVVGVLRRVAARVAAFEPAPQAAGMTSAPSIVSRAQWGANESLRSGSPSFAPVRVAFVHHSAGGNSYTRSQAPGIVRGIYYYHTRSLGWSDVGYNFLVDRYGTVYEGRAGGVTRGVVGAQVLGFNTGSTGVSVMGNFTSVAPPTAAVASLKRLLAWKLDVHHVDPQGTGVLTCALGQKYRTGQRVTFPAVAAHRQANYTSCPGDRLYRLLPAVRKAAAAMGLPKIYGGGVSQDYVSPNGDGVRDKTTLSFTISEPADWRVDVKDQAGATVRSFAGTGDDVAITWAGRDHAGGVLPDGAYELVATAISPRGKARAAVSTVRLDTVAPDVQSAAVLPERFSPNGDGWQDAAKLVFTPAETGTARVRVLDDAGTVVRGGTGWRAVDTSRRAVAWDGRVTDADGALVHAAEGRYAVQLALRDLAGNTTTVLRDVTVDRTVGFAAATPAIFSPNGDGTKDMVSLGFKLTRPAGVMVRVSTAGEPVGTLDAGRLERGARALVWDGKLPGGGSAGSGRYRFDVVASGALGTSVARGTFTVDRYTPRLTAPVTAAVKLGRTATIVYTVRDPYSPKVKVWVTVTDRSGAVVTTLRPGWVKQGVRHSVSWRPRARKRYTLAFRAIDSGGNRENVVVRTVLTVR